MHKRKLDPSPWCPRCQAMLSGLSDASGELPPLPAAGDVTICIYCTAILEFYETAGRLALRELTGKKRAAVLVDPECSAFPLIIARGPIAPPVRRH